MVFSTKNPKPTAHATGAYLLIGTVMWEFFSYYGMRALLILYLSKKLLFSDTNAYSLYGAYTSLVYVTPLIGGYIADKWLGYKFTTIFGSLLIALGHFTLVIPANISLYLGLSLVVLGVGFFKTNAISLLGEFYEKDLASRSSAFSLYYVGGNLGGFLSPIACAFVAKYYGWHWGFIIAAFGMLFGLLMILLGKQHFEGKGNSKCSNEEKKKILPVFYLFTGLLLGLSVFLLIYRLVGYVLVLITICAIFYQVKVHKKADKIQREELFLFYTLAILGTLFWIFDQQGGSSISLFISRNINKTITLFRSTLSIPTAAFQTINPFMILLFGPFVAVIWKKLAMHAVVVSNLMKFFIGMVFFTAGFYFIALNAKEAMITGTSSMGYVVLGLSFVAIAELFIDPTALAFISKVAPDNSVSIMTGIYYLFTGSIANYLAAQFAKLTAIDESITAHSLKDYAAKYYLAYSEVVHIGLIFLFVILLCKWIFRRLTLQ